MNKLMLMGLAIMSLSPFASANISGSIGAESEYFFRGESQGTGTAMQMSLHAENSGWFGGVWASEIDHEISEEDLQRLINFIKTENRDILELNMIRNNTKPSSSPPLQVIKEIIETRSIKKRIKKHQYVYLLQMLMYICEIKSIPPP